MPTGLYTRCEYDTESNRFKPQQNKSRNFENMVMSYFQRQRPDCKIEIFYTTGTQKKIDRFREDGFCEHRKTVFEAMGCFYPYCPCQEARPSLIEEDIERCDKKREMNQMRKQYIEEKGYNVVEMWECATSCCNAHKKHDKRELGLFKEEFRCAEMFCLCSKTYYCYDEQTNKQKFSSRGLNKRTLEDCGDGGPMPEYRKALEEAVNVTSTNRSFRTIQHSVATYEQTKKNLSYFYPRRIVEEDGIHTKPLPL